MIRTQTQHNLEEVILCNDSQEKYFSHFLTVTDSEVGRHSTPILNIYSV